MTDEFYVISLSWDYGKTYLKNSHFWSFSGHPQLYMTHYRDILKAKRYKTLQGALKAVNRIESYYSETKSSMVPEVKALKVELELKTIEI